MTSGHHAARAAANVRGALGIALRPLSLAVLLTACYAIYAVWQGPTISVDSEWYERSGDVLVACGFDPLCYVERVDYRGFFSLLYIGYSAVVGAARAVAGGSARWVLLVVNVLAMGAAAWMTLKSVARLVPNSRGALIVAALTLLVVPDLLSWIPWVLTDSTFTAFMAGVVALTVRAACADNRADAFYALGASIILAAVSSLWRPTGLVVLGWAALCALLVARRHLGPHGVRIANFAVAMVAAASLLSLGLVVVAVTDPNVVPDPTLRSIARDVQFNLAQGNMTYALPEAAPITGVATVLSQAAKRVLYFYAFIAPGFSVAHLTVNWVVYAPLYALSVLGSISACRSGTPAQRDVAFSLVVLLVGFAIFHGFTIIDGEWRYRLPCYSPLAILAGLGAASLFPLRGIPRHMKGRLGSSTSGES